MRRLRPAVTFGAALGAALACSLALAPAARAHQSSVKYVDLTVDGDRAAVRFTVAPADVTTPLGLPDDALPSAAAAATPAAAAYVARWLALALPDGRPCAPAPAPPRAAVDPDGAFVVVRWDAACPAPIRRLRVDLSAFFAVDTRHEAIVTIHPPGEQVDPHVVRAGAPAVVLHAGGPDGDRVAAAVVLALLLLVVIAVAIAIARALRRRRRRPPPRPHSR